MSDVIKWPYGAADSPTISTVTGAIAYTPKNNKTILNLAITGNATLNLTIDPELEDGAELHVSSLGAGTETLTFGTGINAPVLTNANGKTKCQGFVFNKTKGLFEAVGAVVQLD
jgi:hypothetical protein